MPACEQWRQSRERRRFFSAFFAILVVQAMTWVKVPAGAYSCRDERKKHTQFCISLSQSMLGKCRENGPRNLVVSTASWLGGIFRRAHPTFFASIVLRVLMAACYSRCEKNNDALRLSMSQFKMIYLPVSSINRAPREGGASPRISVHLLP